MPVTLQDLDLGTDQRLAQEDGLESMVFLSLFSDARASEDDGLSDGSDLRGWIGDQYLFEPGDSFGSRLWTLTGGRIDVAQEKAPEICVAALQWLIDDGYLAAVEIEVERTDYSQLAINVKCTRPSGQTVDLGPFTVTV